MAVAVGQELQIIFDQMLAPHKLHQQAVESFQADGFVLQHERHVIRGDVSVGKTEADKNATGWAGHEAQGCIEHSDTRAFTADQGAGDVEAVLRKQIVEVVAGNAARNFWIALANEAGVCIAKASQGGVDFCAATAGGDDGFKLDVGGCANFKDGAVVEQDAHGIDVVDSFAAHERMDAAGVVADHAAEGAAAMGGGIGSECQMMSFRSLAYTIENDAGLDARLTTLHVEVNDAIDILGKIEHHGHVAALAGEAGAGATRKNGRVKFAAGGDGGFDIRVSSGSTRPMGSWR